MGSQQPIRKLVLPVIPDKLYFRIGDVAKLCDVPAYVLRFWETEFPSLKPNKGGTGQRLYRKRDVEMALRIKSLLYDQGYTIPGARQVFKSESRIKEAPAAEPVPLPVVGAPVTHPAAPHPADLRRDIALQAMRGEMRAIVSLLSKPVVSTHPSAEGKVKPMRPRLVVEPNSTKPTPKVVALPTVPDRKQRDLFGDDPFEPQPA
jgi:DNA-binding transcriptional MerR regulator